MGYELLRLREDHERGAGVEACDLAARSLDRLSFRLLPKRCRENKLVLFVRL
jgi:hypothetical protein